MRQRSPGSALSMSEQSPVGASKPSSPAAMPPLSPLEGVHMAQDDLAALASSACLPSVATATSPLDYIDGLPDRKGEEDDQKENLRLRGGVEVKLGESGVPEGDKLAEYDFLRKSIESYRGLRGERLQLVPIASSDGASITLGIDVKAGDEPDAATNAASAPMQDDVTIGARDAAPAEEEETGDAAILQGQDQQTSLLTEDIPAVFSSGLESEELHVPGVSQALMSRTEAFASPDLAVQSPGVDTVQEASLGNRRSGGFAKRRTRFGEKRARSSSGSGGKSAGSREPFGSRELIGESEVDNAPQEDIGDLIVEADEELGLGVTGNETKEEEQADATDKSLLHSLEAGFGSTESLPSAFERVLQNQALSGAQDEQGRPYLSDPQLDGTSLGVPSGSVSVPLGWAASIWRTPSPIPWPFNLPPTASPPVSPSSPRSFDSGFGPGVNFLSGNPPSIHDLIRQSSLGDEVLSPNWRPGSALQATLSGGFESTLGTNSPGQALARQSSLEEGTISPSWRPGSAFQPVFPANQMPGFYPAVALSQETSEGSPRGRVAGPAAAPGQVIARPIAITPQVPFSLERVLASQRALETQSSEEWRKQEVDEKAGQLGMRTKERRSGSVDWTRFDGGLEQVNANPEIGTNPLVDSWSGKPPVGFNPFEGYPEAASLQQAAYEEEQRRVIQQNWPYSPPQLSETCHVSGPQPTGSDVAEPSALSLPPAQQESAAPLKFPRPPVATAVAGVNKPLVRSGRSLPVESDKGVPDELRKTNSQPLFQTGSPSNGESLTQEPSPQVCPQLQDVPQPRPIQVKPIAPKMTPGFYPTGQAYFQKLKSQPNFPSPLLRVRLSDLGLKDGLASETHEYAVRNLAASLQNANAAILHLGLEDAKLVREGLAALRLYFEGRRPGELSKIKEGYAEGYDVDGFVRRGNRVAFLHRPGRPYRDSQPPLLPDLYSLLGRTARTLLSSVAHQLGLRSDAFSDLLDDAPLPRGTLGSSVLASERISQQAGAEAKPEGEVRMSRGLFTLVAADTPGPQVTDGQGFWYVADQQMSAGDILVLPGQALQRLTGGTLNPAVYCLNPAGSERVQVAFHLHARPSAHLSAEKLHASRRAVAPSFLTRVTAREFVEGPPQQEGASAANSQQEAEVSRAPEPSLRYTLCDPLSGSPLVDAFLSRCGHSFGGASVQRAAESGTCPLCGKEVNPAALAPNTVLRSAASFLEALPPVPSVRFPVETAVPLPATVFWDQVRQQQIRPRIQPHVPGFGGLAPNPSEGFGVLAPPALTPFKRKLEPQSAPGDRVYGLWPPGFQGLADPRLAKRRPDVISSVPEKPRGVQYPYKVREHVLIKGNKRTPAHVVGKRAIITEQCLNGWYMVRTLDHGETLRLQYRSLERLPSKPEQRPQKPEEAPKNPEEGSGTKSTPMPIDTHTQSSSAPASENENKAVSIAARSQQLVMMALNRRTADSARTSASNTQGPTESRAKNEHIDTQVGAGNGAPAAEGAKT